MSIVSFVLIVDLKASVNAADTPHDLYVAALAREQAVRPTLADDSSSPTVADDVRAVVAAYQAIVRRYPASGYSDNALWQAGRLSLELFRRFGQPQDRNTGVRLLRAVATGYPTSKLVRQVPDELARVDATTGGSGGSDRLRASGASAGLAEARDQHTRAEAEDPPLHVSPQSTVPPNRVGNGLPPSQASADRRSLGGGGQTVPNRKLATIKNIRRVVLTDAVRVVIEFDSEVSFHDERIPSPLRVFVDLPSTRAAPALVDRTLRFEGDNDIVHQIRIGRHPNNTTRVVLDAVSVSSYSVYPLYDPYRLVIDCIRGPEDSASLPLGIPKGTPAPGPPLASRKLSSEWGRVLPAGSPRLNGLIAEAMVPAPLSESPPATLEVPEPVSTDAPLKNLTGGYSIARQLGLSVSRIVIDPGHGGHDPGAKGKSIDEAELVLDIALRVERLLQKVPGTEVILTRRSDEFVPLQERTAIANREGADLFLSIHANASANAAARGVETYFLNFASNLSAASVAARENAASGQSMGALPDFVKAIALNNKLDESRDFATEVQHAMVERLRGGNKTLKDLGVKQAPFVVLIGAAMPSVLTEISFVTNASEAKLLHSNAYRQRIADALFNAIRKYQTSLKHVATVAHQ